MAQQGVELGGVAIIRRGEPLQLPIVDQIVRGQVVAALSEKLPYSQCSDSAERCS